MLALQDVFADPKHVPLVKNGFTAEELGLTLPDNPIYDSLPHGAEGEADDNYGIAAISYIRTDGVENDEYEKTGEPPRDVGTYNVLADFTGYYRAEEYPKFYENQIIGSFEIHKRPVLITPDSGQRKYYGHNDPRLTFTADGALDSTVFTGSLSYAGTEPGEYPIIQGTLSAGDNYILTIAEGILFTILPSENALPQGTTFYIPAEGGETELLFNNGLKIAGLYGGEDYLTQESDELIAVSASTDPFFAIVKLAAHDGKVFYAGIEKPFAVSTGTFDGNTWFIPLGTAADMTVLGWRVSEIIYNSEDSEPTLTNSAISVPASETAAKIIVKLIGSTGRIRYIGIEIE